MLFVCCWLELRRSLTPRECQDSSRTTWPEFGTKALWSGNFRPGLGPRGLRMTRTEDQWGRFITPLPPAKPRKSAQQVGRWDCAELLELGPGGPPSPVMSLGILMSCGKRDVGHRLSSEASRTGCTGCRRRSVPCLVDRRSTSTQAP